MNCSYVRSFNTGFAPKCCHALHWDLHNVHTSFQARDRGLYMHNSRAPTNTKEICSSIFYLKINLFVYIIV